MASTESAAPTHLATICNLLLAPASEQTISFAPHWTSASNNKSQESTVCTVPKPILPLSATLHNGRGRLEGSRWIVIVDRVIIAIRSWWIVIAHVSVVSSIERCCFSGVLAIQSHPPPSYWSIQSQFNIILTTANMILILRQSHSLLITRKRRSWWRKAIYNQGSTTQRLAAAHNNASSKLLSLVSLSHWSHFQATPCGGVLIISNQQK